MVFFLKKYSEFGGGKKKSDSEFLSYNSWKFLKFYNLMLNSGKKICALHDKKNILTLVLSEKIISERKKPP